MARVTVRKGDNFLLMKLTDTVGYVNVSAAIATGEKVTKYLAEKEATKFLPPDPKGGGVDPPTR